MFWRKAPACVHNWLEWAVTERFALTEKWDGRDIGHRRIVLQERKCTKCGYTQIDRQEVVIR